MWAQYNVKLELGLRGGRVSVLRLCVRVRVCACVCISFLKETYAFKNRL